MEEDKIYCLDKTVGGFY